jgi:cyclopropane-fatty-acyl-phospholipid synthase
MSNPAMRPETLCRMWEFDLAGSETVFRNQGLVVFQMQLVKRLDPMPLTRDYLYAEEKCVGQRRGHYEACGGRMKSP